MLPHVLSIEGFPLRANSVELEGHFVQGERRAVAVNTWCTLVLLNITVHSSPAPSLRVPGIHYAKQDKRTPPPPPWTSRRAGYGE